MFGFTGGVSSAVLTQNIVHIRVNKRGRRGKGSKGRQCGRYLDLQEKSNYSPAVGRVPTSHNNSPIRILDHGLKYINNIS